MTRFPFLHETLTGDCQRDTWEDEIRRLQKERLSLLPRQFGRPANRRRMTELTHQQLREELKR